MDVSQGYISDIEAGRSEPSRNFLIRLQEKFGLRADYILYGKGDPVAPETPAPPPRPAPLDQFKLMICGEEVRKIYAALGLDLPSETHFKEGVWFYNELLSRMDDPEDGDELEALLPDIIEMLKARLHNSNRPGTTCASWARLSGRPMRGKSIIDRSIPVIEAVHEDP
jgi:transcriptional regulator with XRE-family HTH domain